MCWTAGDARHPGHDAGGNQTEQGSNHPAAPLGGLEMLESQHPLEGTTAVFVCVCVYMYVCVCMFGVVCVRVCEHVHTFVCVFSCAG